MKALECDGPIAVVARGRSGQIGLNGEIPWHDSNDLKWFRSFTSSFENGILIVGYKTASSLSLPGRLMYTAPRNESPLQTIEKFPNNQLIIIGGAKTYEIWKPFIRRWIIQEIDYDGEADTFLTL